MVRQFMNNWTAFLDHSLYFLTVKEKNFSIDLKFLKTIKDVFLNNILLKYALKQNPGFAAYYREFVLLNKRTCHQIICLAI